MKYAVQTLTFQSAGVFHRGVLIICCALALSAGTDIFAQYKGLPVKKDKLISVLRSRQLQASEIVAVIKTNGVDFRVTPAIEQELVGAGARPEVIDAARLYYRASTAAAAPVPVKGKRPKPIPPPVSNRYDDLIYIALDQSRSGNAQAAIASLQEAISISPTQAQAYQQLGALFLSQQNFVEAEKYMRDAMSRGGSAVFQQVVHDHSLKSFAEFCNGSLFITSDRVQFESDTNISDTFGASGAEIKKAALNSGGFAKMFRVRNASFQIKLNTDKNYNFSPGSDKDSEARLIVKLIGKP